MSYIIIVVVYAKLWKFVYIHVHGKRFVLAIYLFAEHDIIIYTRYKSKYYT